MKQMETDLHLHLDGSLSMDVMKTLAERIGCDLEGKDLEKLLYVGDGCASLAEYLSCFDLPGILLQMEDVPELTFHNLVERLATQGLMCAKIRFALQLHRQKGLIQEQAVEAAVRGVQAGSRESGMYAGVLLCVIVNSSGGDNEETLGLSRAYLGKGVVDADIAGPEGLVPMEHFERILRRIYQANIPFTIHTGECGDYRNVALTVPYGARRIGHGYAAIRSEACVGLLKRENITPEICIVNNLQAKATESTEAHPLKEFYVREIRVTHDTNGMMVSDMDLEREAALITDRVGLTQKNLIRMSEMAVEAGFAGAGVREGILRRVRRQPGIWK